MALQLYRFPMSHGVVTDEGKNFLGLVRSEGEAAFVVYDMEANDIVRKLQYMDTQDWKLNKQLEDHPAGVSDNGAYFVSDWVLDESQGEEFRKPCGMEVRAYDKETAALLATIPVSEGIAQWPVNCRLLTMARLEDGFWLVVFSEKLRSERDFVVSLYDQEGGDFNELWRSTGHQMRYFDVMYRQEDRTITLKRAEEFFYDVYSRNEYDLYTLQLSEDYGTVEQTSEKQVRRAASGEQLLPGLSYIREKRGFLKGKSHQILDDLSGQVLLQLKEGLNTVFEYVAVPGLQCVIVEKSGVMGGGTTYYVIENTGVGFQLTHTLEFGSGARISYDEEAGWITIVSAEETAVLRRA